MTRCLALLAIAGSWATTTARAEPELTRVQATPSWSIAIPRAFKPIDNGDSWQATDGTRVIYVSSLLVTAGPEEPIAATVEKLAAKLLKGADGKTSPVLQYHGGGLEGRAAVFRGQNGFDLKAFMMAKGRVVVCVVSYADPKDRGWAADTWRSLRLAATK